MKGLTIAIGAGLVLATWGWGAQAQPAPAASGEALYTTHCAACHDHPNRAAPQAAIPWPRCGRRRSTTP